MGGGVAQHRVPGVAAVAALHLLVHSLQLEELGIELVDPHQRMPAQRLLDLGVGGRRLFQRRQLAPLVDAALDEDGQDGRAQHPGRSPAHLVEKVAVRARPRSELHRSEVGAPVAAALHHPQEQLRVRSRPADAAGIPRSQKTPNPMRTALKKKTAPFISGYWKHFWPSPRANLSGW